MLVILTTKGQKNVNGYFFPERSLEQIIRYNATCWGYDPDIAWEKYLDD